jgi:hypothetical protein
VVDDLRRDTSLNRSAAFATEQEASAAIRPVLRWHMDFGSSNIEEAADEPAQRPAGWSASLDLPIISLRLEGGDAIARIPGVHRVEDGWRYPDGRWRVDFDASEDRAGWDAVHLIAWSTLDAVDHVGDPVPVGLHVEACAPPVRDRPRSLTFVVTGEGDPRRTAELISEQAALHLGIAGQP